MKNIFISILVLVLVVIVNLTVWTVLNRPRQAQPYVGMVKGITYTPMRQHHDPKKGIYPTPEEIDSDLAVLEGKVHAVRTYTVTEGQAVIPELAAKHQLNVTIGAWIGSDLERNEREIANLIQLGQKNRNVVRTIVGNEALLREEVTVEQMIGYLRQVRGRSGRPISTSEPHHIWMKYPELVKEVDFIAVHILPYWEGLSVKDSINFVFEKYDQLKTAYPDKEVVITEVGWPSNGKPIRDATASLVSEAAFLREFLNIAHDRKITYYVIEAFDQPWKMTLEGSTGGYWGVFDADRKQKFPMEGGVIPLPGWQQWAMVAAIIAVVPVLLLFAKRGGLRIPGKLLFGINANLGASFIAWTASLGVTQYHSSLTATFWVILVMMQIVALVVLLVESIELAEVLWARKSERHFQPLAPSPDYPFPKVSLHLPIHNEPPAMVCETLDALAEMDYPQLEVLVLDNNTKDPTVWQPVEDYCRKLGPKFRFFHLENWPGFKAGALNFGLEQTAPDAEIIAVIDSDYVVNSDWLKSLVPYFGNPEVSFVQAPQDYRDGNDNLFKKWCYWEYAGFFHIGMVQRNEYNAIIQHGTMTMVRKSALLEVGKWGEWCICEDSELGLRLFRAGYDSVYVNHSFGRGVTPDTLSAYKTQRFRWVYGGMQILKRHWSALTGRNEDLTPAQRYYFLAGWMPWFSDAFSLLFTFGSLLLTAIVLIEPMRGELPVIAFLLPSIFLFSFKLLRSVWLYSVRVRCSLGKTLGAALAGLALTHTVAKAIIIGMFSSGRPFVRTPKCEEDKPFLSGFRMVEEETLLLILLWGAVLLLSRNSLFDNTEGRLWISVLLIQSVPYAASVLTAFISVAPSIGFKKK
ncbi:MAG: glycosyltransferase [Gammaproteobacteria bacterium]